MNSKSTETLRLISKLLEKEISEDEFSRLNELLEHDPKTRQLYIRSMHMHDQLPDIVLSKIPRPASINFVETLSESEVPAGPGWSQNLLSLAVGGTITACLVASAFWFFGSSGNGPDGSLAVQTRAPVEVLDPNVAVVTEAIDVEWSESPSLGSGDGAAPG